MKNKFNPIIKVVAITYYLDDSSFSFFQFVLMSSILFNILLFSNTKITYIPSST